MPSKKLGKKKKRLTKRLLMLLHDLGGTLVVLQLLGALSKVPEAAVAVHGASLLWLVALCRASSLHRARVVVFGVVVFIIEIIEINEINAAFGRRARERRPTHRRRERLSRQRALQRVRSVRHPSHRTRQGGVRVSRRRHVPDRDARAASPRTLETTVSRR